MEDFKYIFSDKMISSLAFNSDDFPPELIIAYILSHQRTENCSIVKIEKNFFPNILTEYDIDFSILNNKIFINDYNNTLDIPYIAQICGYYQNDKNELIFNYNDL